MPYLNDEAANAIAEYLTENCKPGTVTNEEECLLNSMRGQGIKCEPFKYDNEFAVIFPEYESEYVWLVQGELVYTPHRHVDKDTVARLVAKLRGVSEHANIPLRVK